MVFSLTLVIFLPDLIRDKNSIQMIFTSVCHGLELYYNVRRG